MFEKINKAIGIYNKLVMESGKEYQAILQLQIGTPNSEQEIKFFQSVSNRAVPEELYRFYAEIGSLRSDSFNENNCIDVFSISYLLDRLNDSTSYSKTLSLGLILGCQD